ncbi:MAG: tetratricopeptide repeat protein [Candidatus Melainabacteria bacterium]|nr:tetratricopeptide repeat protein [Candidatus Melainabacteria bacterium]
MPTSELPYGAIKIFIALVGMAGAGSLMMWLGSSPVSTIRSWELVRASQRDAITRKNLAEAEALGRQAIRLAERLGSSNYRVAISHEDLGQILVAEKNAVEARKHFDDAEKILQTNIVRAKDNLTKRLLLADLASTQRNLGLIELANGHAEITEELFKNAIANLESCLKSPSDGRLDFYAAHSEVDLLSRLANIYVISGRDHEALKLFRQAIDLADQSFYPTFLIKPVKDEFARLLKRDGRDQEAEALYSYSHWAHYFGAAENAKNEEDTLAMAKNLRLAADAAKGSKSTMHLAVITLKKLAKLQLQQKNTVAFRETCLEALHVWKTLGGGADSEADYVMGLLIRQAQNKQIAIEIQSGRLKLRRDLYGKTDFHTAETLTELACLYCETGDTKTAKIYAEEAYDIFHKLRIKSRGIGVQELFLAGVFEQLGELPKAEAMYSRSLSAQMKRNRKNAAKISEIYKLLSAVYKRQGKATESRNAQGESRRWRSYLAN